MINKYAVPLDPRNDEAWQVYLQVMDFVKIAGLGEVIGLDFLEVNRFLDFLGYPEDWRRIDLWDKLCTIFRIHYNIDEKIKEKEKK